MSEREKIYFYMNIPDDKLSPEKLKEKRKYKMIFYSTLYRFKQRIEKQLKKIILNIENLEEEYEKTENIDKYLDKIKEKLKKVKKEIKTRERIKRDVKNKRSKEFMVLQNVNHGKMLLEEDENILKSIEEANDEEIDLILGMDYQKYYNIINAYDPDFLIDLNPINVMKNDFTNFNADLELLKVSEILFEPSIIGIQQPGLKEIFNELRNERIKNVLICGGFANIKNLKERIEQELKYCLFYNEFNIKIADDLVFDQFEGAKFCDAFKTFSIEEFNNFGIEQLLKDENVFLN
ncbi:Actin- protein 5 [Gurleya vavrai]